MDTMAQNWYGKPYYSLDAFCKNTFGHKCYKIALNAHLTCPNRDGTLGTRGCIFCSKGAAATLPYPFWVKLWKSSLQRGFLCCTRKTQGSISSLIFKLTQIPMAP